MNLINQSNTSQLKINDSYLMTYTHVGTKYVPQTNWQISCQLHDSYSKHKNWLENKMCHQFDDISLPVINDLNNLGTSNIYVNCYNNWLKNIMCHQFNDSCLPVINNLNNLGTSDIYVNCYNNWLENIICRQSNDSRLPAKTDLDRCGNYSSNTNLPFTQLNWLRTPFYYHSASNESCCMRRVNKIKTHYEWKNHEIKQIICCLFWHKNKMCHACNDSWLLFVNYVIRQATRCLFGLKIECAGNIMTAIYQSIMTLTTTIKYLSLSML